MIFDTIRNRKSNWVTVEEMRTLLLADDETDITPDELPAAKCERLMDELVEEGVARRRGDHYQLVGAERASRYIEANR